MEHQWGGMGGFAVSFKPEKPGRAKRLDLDTMQSLDQATHDTDLVGPLVGRVSTTDAVADIDLLVGPISVHFDDTLLSALAAMVGLGRLPSPSAAERIVSDRGKERVHHDDEQVGGTATGALGRTDPSNPWNLLPSRDDQP